MPLSSPPFGFVSRVIAATTGPLLSVFVPWWFNICSLPLILFNPKSWLSCQQSITDACVIMAGAVKTRNAQTYANVPLVFKP